MSILNPFSLQNVMPKNICFPDEISTKFENLLNWQNGYVSPKIEFLTGEYGIGVFSKENIEIEEILILVETENMITVEKVFEVLKKGLRF